MKDLIQIITVFLGAVLLSAAIFVYLIGPTAFLISLSVIGLLIYGSGCAIGGAWWTEKTIKQGATIAITATSRNDEYDTRKIEALADFAEVAVKGYAQTQNQMLKTREMPQLLSNSSLRFEDAIFEELEG